MTPRGVKVGLAMWKQVDPVNRLIFPGVSLAATYDHRGKPFVGEKQIRDVLYKTTLLQLQVLVPGGICAPPGIIRCPALMVRRMDSRTRDKCRGRGTIIYMHGNATDVGGTADEAKTMARELECHVVVPEYPGFGRAEGTPTEDSVDAVLHAAIRFATETLGTPRDRLILYGRSVGTGPVATAGARMSCDDSAPPAAIILQSPFTSILDFAKEKTGFLAYMFVSERWPTKENLLKVTCPMFLIHGDRDEVVPFSHSKQLRGGYKKYKACCDLHVQMGAYHNSFDLFGDVIDPMAAFLKRHSLVPWGAEGKLPATEMDLNLSDMAQRVLIAGPGDVCDYPFMQTVQAPGKSHATALRSCGY